MKIKTETIAHVEIETVTGLALQAGDADIVAGHEIGIVGDEADHVIVIEREVAHETGIVIGIETEGTEEKGINMYMSL